MKISIEGDSKEIAAFVLELQKRQGESLESALESLGLCHERKPCGQDILKDHQLG